jgi:drug/metabolite transporter (DMT)-like permease
MKMMAGLGIAAPRDDAALSNPLLGFACAGAMVCIWTGFIVFSRDGALSGLTPYDLAALRFGVSGLLLLPFTFAWWPRHISLGRALLLSLFGPGMVYALLAYSGLALAPAAYGGVFSNGAMPIFTVLFTFLIVGIGPGRLGAAGIVLILLGSALLALFDLDQVGDLAWLGALFFLGSAAVLSFYTVGVRLWRVSPRQALAVICLPNALFYLPLWYAFLPSSLSEASFELILFQALYQGLGPAFLAVILYALAVRHLGSAGTAGFSALVPASATLLAIPWLGEWPSAYQWTGVALVTLGLTLLLWRRRPEG